MYFPGGQSPYTLGLLKEYVAYQVDGWRYIVDAVKHHFDNVLAAKNDKREEMPVIASLFEDLDKIKHSFFFSEIVERIYSEMVSLLGVRTGEMHLALHSLEEDPAFAPEPFSMLYQRSIYQSVRSLIRNTYRLLGRSLQSLPEDFRGEAAELLENEQQTLSYVARILQNKLSAQKIRIHGDYHLGQVLFTGKDFVITNFEGPSAQAVSERKLKRSPLRDAAGMIWSFHYASYTALYQYKTTRSEEISILESFAEQWWLWMGSVFLQSYYETVKQAGLLPGDKKELEYLLRIYLLEKKMYELHYALKNNPAKAKIPIKGIKFLSKYFITENRRDPVVNV